MNQVMLHMKCQDFIFSENLKKIESGQLQI